MNPTLYKLGTACVQWVGSLEAIASSLDHFTRIWQRHRKLRSRLRAAGFDAVIDGGANIGEFAQLARAALPAAEIVCVEPHPKSASALRKNGFEVVEAALWKETGRITLTQPTDESTSCTVRPSARAAAGAFSRTWDVAAVRLDDLEIAGSRVLLKLDLQGAELDALAGMDKLWNRCAGILLEVSLGTDGTYEPIRRLLSERGFSEYSTTNELEVDGRVMEADKLWLRSELIPSATL